MVTVSQSPIVVTTETKSRLEYIDGLRGVAILLVLMTHTWNYGGAPALSFHVFHVNVMLAAVPAIGYVGVNLFLVLSGFCLSYPFFRNPQYRQEMTLRKFWKKRARRILPAYYFSITLVFLMTLLFAFAIKILPSHLATRNSTHLTELPTLIQILPHIFLVHNLSANYVGTINGSYWSLALEFQLYLLFPLLIELFFRWGPWRTLAVVAVLQLVYRYYIYAILGSLSGSMYDFVLPKSVFGRMLDFYLGIMAAYLVIQRPEWLRVLTGRFGSLIGLLILLSAFVVTDLIRIGDPILDLLWALGFSILICGASYHKNWCGRALQYKPLVRLGVASYSVYLIHQPIVERLGYLIRLALKAGPAYILLTALIPLIIAIGFLFFKWVEYPFLSAATQKAEQKELSSGAVI